MNLVQLLHKGNPCAPMRCKQYSFDINQQAQSLSAWDQEYNQHSTGQFPKYDRFPMRLVMKKVN